MRYLPMIKKKKQLYALFVDIIDNCFNCDKCGKINIP